LPLLADATAAFACIGLIQAGMGVVGLHRFFGGATTPPGDQPPVSILKPLKGDEPLLEAALASFFTLNYPDYQLVFGVQDSADPAIAVVERLRRLFPERDVALVIDSTPHGGNGKIANLINMLPQARHDVLILSDSDVHVSPSFIDCMTAGLSDPEVGVVTALYTGVAGVPGLPARLGAAHINHVFLPGVLAGHMLGREDCLGAALALRRTTLARIGGLPALLPHLADDAALGRLAHGLGLQVALAPIIVMTTVAEGSLRALLRHELRWARTIRSLAPVFYATSLLQYPLFWSLATLAIAGPRLWVLVFLVVVWLLRATAARALSVRLRQNGFPLWLLPLREMISVGIVIAAYLGNQVIWRGTTMQAVAGEDLRRVGSRPRRWKLKLRRSGTTPLPRGISHS
jgi:ceramide glucosyltransferase